MKKDEHLKYCKKVADVLGYDRLHNLDKLQRQSLNNQLNDLIEERDYVVETVQRERQKPGNEAFHAFNELFTRFELTDEAFLKV